MFVIKPIDINDALLTASNVTEADATEWLPATAFTAGQTCMVTTTANGAATATHGIYTAVINNTGNDPTVDTGTNWTFTAYTNRFKMFDGIVQSQTTRTGGIEVEITPATYTPAIALINVNAESVDIVVTSVSDGEVYNESYSMTSYSGIDDWWEYFYTPIERLSELIVTDLPMYLDAAITVSINDTGLAACGELALGTIFTIGDSLHGANLGIIDYSVKNTNPTTGEITVSSGAYAKRSQVDVLCMTNRTPFINAYLTSILNTPVVWVADPDNGATIVYGYYREFNTILSDNYSSLCNLQIEGLT